MSKPLDSTTTRADFVAVTRNTEYRLKAGRCIAVRRRAEPSPLSVHPALGVVLRGWIISMQPWKVVDEPVEGAALWFIQRDGHDFITSRVESVRFIGDPQARALTLESEDWLDRDESNPSHHSLLDDDSDAANR